MVEDISAWLKTTIPGIVLLGAFGSILAVVITRALLLFVGRVIPLPAILHKERRRKQSFFLGFAAAHIERDETGKILQAYLSLHLALLFIALFMITLLVSLFSILLAFQGETMITTGVFVTITAAFLAAYWAYFEFEYIYRTYLFFWKAPMKKGLEHYEEWQLERKGGNKPNKAMQPTPKSGAADG
jgi:hypothetical protein